MKWYVKILIVLVIIAVIVVAVFLVHDKIQKKQYPLLNYEYESRDSFYEVFEEVEDVEIIDNDYLLITTKEIEIVEDEEDTYRYTASLLYTVENFSGEIINLHIKSYEVNGKMRYDEWNEKYIYLEPGEEADAELWLSRDEEAPEINRISIEFEIYMDTAKGYSLLKEYVRIYPHTERAYKFEPPEIHNTNILDVSYDKKDIVLAITNDSSLAYYGFNGGDLCYFLYNGTKGIIDADVELEAINGFANYIEDNWSMRSWQEDEEMYSYVLPGAYYCGVVPTDICDFSVAGYDREYRYEIHYCITGTKNTIDDTAKIYPYGKDAYEKHSYEYDENDVVIYEDEEYKVSAISAEKDDYSDRVEIFYYIENKTNSEMRFSMPFSQICDTLVYDGFDFEEEKRKHDCQFITQSNGDTVTCNTVYATAMESDTCYVALCIGRADEEEDRVQIIVPFKIPFDQEDE